jgi:hypothetical protein
MIRHSALLAVMLATLLGGGPLFAETPALRFNPFERPDLGEITPVKNTLLEPAVTAPELTATVVSSEEPMVILEGEFLRIGEEREGYRLVSVSEGSALFDHQGQQVEIKVSEPAADTRFRR